MRAPLTSQTAAEVADLLAEYGITATITKPKKGDKGYTVTAQSTFVLNFTEFWEVVAYLRSAHRLGLLKKGEST